MQQQEWSSSQLLWHKKDKTKKTSVKFQHTTVDTLNMTAVRYHGEKSVPPKDEPHQRWTIYILIHMFTLSESVRHACNAELCSSFLGSFKHPLDVLWIVSI